jgi:hypothetical protein
MSGSQSFYAVLTAAVNDLSLHGFDGIERVESWVKKIRAAAIASMIPEYMLDEQLKATFKASYTRLVERGTILKYHPGVSKFTLSKVAPALRKELDKQIMASANLIKLNREAAIQKTLQRFSGWSTSIPVGGTEQTDRVETKTEIRKALAQLPFQERRVAIDQGHKFISNLNNIIANDAGAIALRWHSHWRQTNYDYREDHKERDDKVYVIRGNWALDLGLMKLDGHQYYDEITAVGEEVSCRCFTTYIYSLRSLPPDMLTEKGRAKLAEVRIL